MNETTIKPITGVRPSDSGISSKPLTTIQAEAAPARKPTASETDSMVKPVETDTEKSNGNSSNVSIHFRLDEETHDLTIFVVDRKTKRVIRSVPASELHKLQAGDLLKLTA